MTKINQKAKKQTKKPAPLPDSRNTSADKNGVLKYL